MKKVLTLFSTAVLALGGVACSGGGASDEFCDAALTWVGLIGENLGAGETGSISYAELDASVAEITGALDDMAASTEDEDVLDSIATVKTAFEDFAEERDMAPLQEEDVQEAVDRIEAYAADCEGFEEAANEAGAE